MKLFSRLLDRRIASYQQELIETHYGRSTICTGRSAAGGTTTAITSRR